MAEFKKGDIVYHKATQKRCVVRELRGRKVIVTTEDDQIKTYNLEELWTEKEWNSQNEIVVA